MKRPLNKQIQHRFSRHSLSENQLSNLQERIDAGQPGTASTRTWFTASIASMFVIAMIVLNFMPQTEKPKNETMVQRIAHEVVKNHLNRKPLEVHTNTLDGLIHYFTQLEFILRPSRELNHYQDELMGGRYCSLQGVTAAQLRLKSSSSLGPDTLYQLVYSADVFGPIPDIDKQQTPLVAWSRGIKVKVWVEKGVLFARTDLAAAE